MRKDVKDYWQECKGIQKPNVSIILLTYLCKMYYNDKKLQCLLNIGFIWP